MLTRFFYLLPLFFGIGFLAPLVEVILGLMGIEHVMGVSPVLFGFLVGGIWGAIAVWRGRWI